MHCPLERPGEGRERFIGTGVLERVGGRCERFRKAFYNPSNIYMLVNERLPSYKAW